MLKVIQVKIQDYTSCRKKSSEIVWLDRSRNRLNRSRIISVEFVLSPNSSSSPLRIRVLGLLLLVYKENLKHVFKRLLERYECAFFVDLGFCTQKLSRVFVKLCDESFMRPERCLPSYTHIELSRSRFTSRTWWLFQLLHKEHSRRSRFISRRTCGFCRSKKVVCGLGAIIGLW